ncbi:MAG: polysaccharide deacetylase family protein [Fluviicola sp.]
MLIFVDQISERLIYIKEFIFDSHGIIGDLTNDKNYFQSYDGEKCIFSDISLDGIPTLKPSALLFEEKLGHKWNIQLEKWNELECFSFDGIVDPLASIFYVLSRFEEYGLIIKDEHDRFSAKMSLQYKHNLLQRQIVEEWIELFVKTYSPSQLELLEKNKTVTFIPTFDIDNTFAFKWKEGWRSWLSNCKDFFNNQPNRRVLRKKVQKGLEQDPFDCYDYLESIANQFPETHFFWLVGDFAQYDKNITLTDPRHQKLISKFDAIDKVGLHPSYASNLNFRKLELEKERLETVLNRTIETSRQHFLKLNFPNTYESNRKLKFTTDFTMGYADEVGFRAGTARKHYFFDLIHNDRTNYEIVPFVYMDGTLNEYKRFSIDEALQCVDELIVEVEKYGGVFCCLWHNESIAEAGKWKGWRGVFEHTIEQFK